MLALGKDTRRAKYHAVLASVLLCHLVLSTGSGKSEIGKEDNPPSEILGAVLAAGYLILNFASSVADAASEHISPATQIVFLCVGLFAVAFAIPLVRWVNDLNTDNNMQSIHGKWNVHSFGLLAAGIVFWTFVLIGVFLPE